MASLSKGEFDRFLKIFKKKGLAQKLSIFILILLIIPISIIDFFSVSKAVSSLINESKKSYLVASSSTAQYFQVLFEAAKNNAVQLMANDNIQTFFSEAKLATKDDDKKTKIVQDAKNTLANLVVTNEMFAGAYILTDKANPLVFPSIATNYLDFQKIKNSGWYKKIVDSAGYILIDSHQENFDEVIENNNGSIPAYACSIGFQFRDLQTNKLIGIMLLDIKEDWLRNQLQSTELSRQGVQTIGLLRSGKIILPADFEDTTKHSLNSDEKFIKKVLSEVSSGKNEGAFETIYQQKPYLITFSKTQYFDWIIVGMIPLDAIIKSARSMEKVIILITIVFTIIAIVFGIFFALRIAKDIEKVTYVMTIAEKGDLTQTLHIKRNDEIGTLSKSFNNMSKNIKNLIEKGVNLTKQVTSSIASLTTIASETSSASNEIAKAIQEIAEGAGNQAKEATNVAETVSQFGERIESIVYSIKQINKLSKDVFELSENGSEAVKGLDKATDHTVSITNSMIETINQLADYSKSIGKIIHLLGNISEQTKLLALNASIEAAKAGEAGRGFAVVASEIKKLAVQSKESTREVDEMIKKIISQTKAAQEVASKVEVVISDQNTAVETVTGAFSKIRSVIEELFVKVENINQSILMIDKEKTAIISSIENISAISQETAASTQEVSASTQEQLAAIEELKSMIEKLYVLAQDLHQAMQVFKI
ncbi:methyl-accepting chemotaxis sensory transducer [Caldicellulosiruptor owensensis OL]|uniref:Methyl-accepting chemotaxis sensory transducer n=1 Tax=Caldicellulosiruptor owensensis (strain ATCC 700167 / DSM 13100 / OL) TaxID=632518 RepID=E4Q1X4_CALOW|nr:methyl-accepting chemotaxis protein [Caldicellulosiruptor owensensis]ADQ03673.1 methyl-accepting chemotaxis sensory transducer [Caldicellulosiruptor owensensis OL]